MSKSTPFRVMLEPEQHRRLQALAERRGVSMASLIRESVASYVTDADGDEDPLAGIVDLFEDDGPRPFGDVGEEHDAYLAATLADWEQKPPSSAPGPKRRRRSARRP
jgi:hypothetical protein